MSVTRKDLNAIAAALASTRPQHLEATTTRPHLTEAEEQWAQTLIAVDLVLSHLNPRHSTKKFHDACFAERPVEAYWWVRVAHGERPNPVLDGEKLTELRAQLT